MAAGRTGKVASLVLISNRGYGRKIGGGVAVWIGCASGYRVAGACEDMARLPASRVMMVWVWQSGRQGTHGSCDIG